MFIHFSVLSLSVLFLTISTRVSANAANKSPILIIPGHSGSILNVQDSSNSDCNTNGELLRIWVNVTVLATSPECFSNQMRFNYTSNNYLDPRGVTVTAAYFGNTSSVEVLDLQNKYPYFKDFVEYFVDRGYVKDKSIRAAPYDWRLAPDQLLERGYYTALKTLVQTMYEDNGNAKVTLVVHSMGGPVSLYFLTKFVDQEWKDMYINNYVTLAGAWAGSNGDLLNLLSGPSFNPFPKIDYRDIYRTMPSFYYLLPRESVWKNTVIVTTPTKKYTTSDYAELFTDAGYPRGYTQFTEISIDWPAPNVSTYCFYAIGDPTPERFVYETEFPDTQPKVTNGNGDNTINQKISEICQQWAHSGYPFKRTVVHGTDHRGIVSDKAVLETIAGLVGAK